MYFPLPNYCEVWMVISISHTKKLNLEKVPDLPKINKDSKCWGRGSNLGLSTKSVRLTASYDFSFLLNSEFLACTSSVLSYGSLQFWCLF